jgi:hypothetical protein
MALEQSINGADGFVSPAAVAGSQELEILGRPFMTQVWCAFRLCQPEINYSGPDGARRDLWVVLPNGDDGFPLATSATFAEISEKVIY